MPNKKSSPGSKKDLETNVTPEPPEPLKTHYRILLVFTAIGTLVDGMASGLILLSMIQSNNFLGQLLAFAGGAIITGAAVTTRVIFYPGTPKILRYVWIVAVIIDVYSTVIGTIYYGVLGFPLGTVVDFSLIQINSYNVVSIALALGLAFIITGSSLISLHILEKAF